MNIVLNMDTRNGALITDVVENSSIEETGLKKGDVIIGFNGKFIAKPADLHRMVLRSHSGSNNKVKVLRNGISKTINLLDWSYLVGGIINYEIFIGNKISKFYS